MIKSAAISESEKRSNPDLLQRTASNPHDSVWVSASAGTGKTKVLTDRVLRLLLPRSDGQSATPAHKILCLTFTKAAASEMANRINKMLAAWAVMPVEVSEGIEEKKTLRYALSDLLGHDPSADQIEAAQQLFANIVDCVNGLQILTIHSFCQSLLGRFPLEADLPPNFKVLDETQSSEYLREAKAKTFSEAVKTESAGSALYQAYENILQIISEDSLDVLLNTIINERFQLRAMCEKMNWNDLEGQALHQALCNFLDISTTLTAHDLIDTFVTDQNRNDRILIELADVMLVSKNVSDQKSGRIIKEWLILDKAGRFELYDAYRNVLLKSDGEPRTHNFPTKEVFEKFPEGIDHLRAESEKLVQIQEQVKAIQTAQGTRDLMVIGFAVLDAYEVMKHDAGLLDFNDLIVKTLYLLQGKTLSFSSLDTTAQSNSASWIMYKMDQGLDHILVDEAQDTNPEQWRIIEAICNEFFVGLGARDNMQRTSFTVGDIKQSIYGFQRAAPEEFLRMQKVLDQRIRDSGQSNQSVALEVSFRSTAPVLSLVDATFDDAHLTNALGGIPVHHQSYRAGQAGRVELWPVQETDKTDSRDFWAMDGIHEKVTGSAKLADYVAKKISEWITGGEILPSYDRPIQAGDIMILVKSRSAFVDQVVRTLKSLNIPVSGVDRMKLDAQLVVQDLLAMARFCLFPDDDLTLACVLKSPFLGWSEEDLFALAYQREGSLWQEMAEFNKERLKDLPEYHEPFQLKASYAYLEALRQYALNAPVFAFFSMLLQKVCPANPISGLMSLQERLGQDIVDPLQEFMNKTIGFARQNTDSLQVFIDAFGQDNTEVKRELEEGGDKVRIMTVHGSKGLQAPIVILPDTLLSSSGNKSTPLLLPDKTGLDFPLWRINKDNFPKKAGLYYKKLTDREEEEYYRLLYVAMTRAADRLYVAGYKGTKNAQAHSWYYKIKQAYERIDGIEKLEDDILRYETAQADKPDKKEDHSEKSELQPALPEWAREKAREEQYPARPIVPSRMAEDEEEKTFKDVFLSPLVSLQVNRFRRGNLTHKLLQFLPDIQADRQDKAAKEYLARYAHDISEDMAESICNEVMKILRNPEFAPFFANPSFAEVSVTGVSQDGRIISGQIDRLVIGPKEIWILDYKTNRPPPKDPKNIPHIYYRQMKAYKDLIKEIYPSHTLHCALLWTDGPFVTKIE